MHAGGGTPGATLGQALADEFSFTARVPSLFLAGVPQGYPDQAIPYADSPDPTVQASLGIGPGCEDAGVMAPPPVRLANAAVALDGDDGAPESVLRPLCQPSYDAAVADLADRLVAAAQYERCVTRCPADVSPQTPGLQVACHAQMWVADPNDPDARDEPRAVPPCVLAPEGWDDPDGETEVCVRYLTGDELPAACSEVGFPLAFRIERRDPARWSARDTVSITCEPADLDDPQQAAFCAPP